MNNPKNNQQILMSPTMKFPKSFFTSIQGACFHIIHKVSCVRTILLGKNINFLQLNQANNEMTFFIPI